MKKDLYFINTQIQQLPDGLVEVGGDLALNNTEIQQLPDGLKVKTGLYLVNTQIQQLPDGLEVGGGLFIRNTPLSKTTTPEELKAKYPGIKREIFA